MMADPVWAYRKNYEPKEVLFEAINRLQRTLAELPAESTTVDQLRPAFERLWRSLEDSNQVVMTAHTSAAHDRGPVAAVPAECHRPQTALKGRYL